MLLIAAPAAAEDPEADWGYGFYLDQDLAIPFLNEDRDYTMGVAAEFFWQEKARGLYPLDSPVRRIGEWLGLFRKDDEIVRSFMLGSVTYTPDDLADPDPIYDDRPYASLIYLSNKRVRANPRSAVGAELQLGVLGTTVAESVQTGLHRLWRDATGETEPVDPMGWDHQISNGGEPTLRLTLSRSRLLAESPGRWDLAATGSLALGYQTNLSLGVSARAGRPASAFWSLPYDPVNRGNFLPSKGGDEWYGWVAYRVRLVGYDALLQGQFEPSDVTFSYDRIEHILHEGGFGFTLAYHKYQLTLAANAKTPELCCSAGRRSHYWGGLYLMRRY